MAGVACDHLSCDKDERCNYGRAYDARHAFLRQMHVRMAAQSLAVAVFVRMAVAML
jgi:hypothetical protein